MTSTIWRQAGSMRLNWSHLTGIFRNRTQIPSEFREINGRQPINSARGQQYAHFALGEFRPFLRS